MQRECNVSWRVAGSLLTLLAEINAAHPKRDKRTDGTISGYPGAISSHNINAAGVVCALDITTGMFSGGITPAQGVALADKIRIKLRDQPRGIPCYVIHNGKIASAGNNYAWLPYGGPDPHTSHIHVSVDWDIPAGGAASGQADYDSALPWGIAGVSTKKEDDMSDEDVKKVNKYTGEMLWHGFTSEGKKYPGIGKVTIENQRRINETTGKVDAITELVKQIAAGSGVAIDYAKVEAAAAAGVSRAMAEGIDLDATVSIKAGTE